MLSLESISKSYGEQLLFSDLSLHINNGERVGLIGPNGSGKTTIFKIITGEIPPDKGLIHYPKNSIIGYLPQNFILMMGSSVMDEMFHGFLELRNLRRELYDMELHGMDTEYDAKRYAEISNSFKELNGFSIIQEAKHILRGMGFNESDFERGINEFSGGWQMRILLSRILLIKPDILLLDEPTNHLDLEALNWLENFLTGFKGIVIAVTHDRYFLNKFTKRICELHKGAIKNYYGSYEDFLFEKAHIKESVKKKYYEQNKRIRQSKQFINKFKARKDMRGRVRSRIKMLEKMERIELPKETKSIHFSFPQPKRSGSVPVKLSNIVKQYTKNHVLNGVDLAIQRGDSIGLVGQNGIGKSTLLRILAGVEGFSKGERTLGHNVSIQFFSQEDVTFEAKGKTVLDEAQITAPELDLSELRTYLGAFLFAGDDVHKRIEILSGGEQSRLKLAKMLLKPGNLLILDEPSNHLDIQGKEVLEEALTQFSGTIVLASHDRFMLDRICNKTATIVNGKLKLYWGNYSYYLEKRKEEFEEQKNKKQVYSGKKKERERKRVEAEMRGEIYIVKKKIDGLEKVIGEKEKRLREKENLLLLPQTYKDGSNVKVLIKEINSLKGELDELYFSFGKMQTLLEQMKDTLS